jgi:hypothetical protein
VELSVVIIVSHFRFRLILSLIFYERMSEGLATLYGYETASMTFAEEQLKDFYFTEVVQPSLDADAWSNTRPMTHEVETPKTSLSFYDKMTGYKGENQ